MGELIYLDVFSKEECCLMEKSMNTNKLLEADPELTVSKKVAGPNFEIMMLIEDLLKIHQRGKDTPLLFNNRLPKSEKTVTKTMIHTADRIRAIYEGKFGREFRISPEFIDRYDSLITKETWERLSEIKGSWDAVRAAIFEAARNYRQWWWPENEPEKKDWLTRDISTWLFDNYYQTSLFLACLVRGPYPVRETAADRVYNSIPAGVRKQAEGLYQPSWDAIIFWSKIRDIVYWFEGHRDLEGNIGYWFDGGINVWFENYLKWLDDLAGQGLYLSHIGTDCPTWNAWCTWGARKHNFKLPLKNR
jgi:hypothetical protein